MPLAALEQTLFLMDESMRSISNISFNFIKSAKEKNFNCKIRQSKESRIEIDQIDSINFYFFSTDFCFFYSFITFNESCLQQCNGCPSIDTNRAAQYNRWRSKNKHKNSCGNRSQNCESIIMIVNCEREAAATPAEKKWKIKVIIEWNLLFSLMAIRIVHSSLRARGSRIVLYRKKWTAKIIAFENLHRRETQPTSRDRTNWVSVAVVWIFVSSQMWITRIHARSVTVYGITDRTFSLSTEVGDA